MPYTPYHTATGWQQVVDENTAPDQLLIAIDILGALETGGGGGGTNIYNSDGTLTADRTVTTTGKDLTFTGDNFELLFTPIANAAVGFHYLDAQTESSILVNYDSGTGYSVAGLSNVDIATGNESHVGTAFDHVGLGFLDFAVNANTSNSLFINGSGAFINGNTVSHIATLTVHGVDAFFNELDSAVFYNDGKIEFTQYINTQDDTGTFTPTSFLYTGAAGELYVAPLSALGGSFWLTTGNTGLTDGVDNFLGTTDAIPIRFLLGNDPAGILEGEYLGSTANTAIGAFSLYSNMIGIANTAFGRYALHQAISDKNVAIGTYAGYGIITGINNTCIGSETTITDVNNTIGLGFGASPLLDNEFAIGTQTHLNFELNGGSDGYVLTRNGANNQDWQSITFATAAAGGASGSFTTTDLKTVTVTDGIITAIA